MQGPTPCHNWLGLNNYDSDESVSKSSWLQEHQKLMQATNQHAFKSIKKSAYQTALRTGGKELSIPEGNLVLLWDHPEGHNKDCFKDQEFVVVKQLCEPNVYPIKPVNGVSPEQVVNCRQLQDLQKAHDNNNNSNKEVGNVPNVPSFNCKVKLKNETPHTHR